MTDFMSESYLQNTNYPFIIYILNKIKLIEKDTAP